MGKLRAKPHKSRKRHVPRWVALERRLPKGSLSGLLVGLLFAGFAAGHFSRMRPDTPAQLWLHAIAVLAGMVVFLWAVRQLWLHAKPCYEIKAYGGGPKTGRNVNFRYRYRGDASDLSRVTFATGWWNSGGSVTPSVHLAGPVAELPEAERAEGAVQLFVQAPVLFRHAALWVEITDRKGHRRDSVYSIP